MPVVEVCHRKNLKSTLKDLEHASQKDSHGVSANVLDEDVLEQICWTYADPDEKGSCGTTTSWTPGVERTHAEDPESVGVRRRWLLPQSRPPAEPREALIER